MYAFAVVSVETPGQEIVAVRNGPPLVVGLGDGEHFLASDPPALLAHTRDVVFLEDGDIGRMTPAGVEFQDRAGKPVQRPVQRVNWDPIRRRRAATSTSCSRRSTSSRGPCTTPSPGASTSRRGRGLPRRRSRSPDEELERIERVHLLACGTSWHAALVGKFLIETLARVPVEVDYGSEYRYRDPIVSDRTLAVGHLPVGRDGRHAGGACEAAHERGARLHRDLQRGRQHGDPRAATGRSTPTPARRSASPRPRRSPSQLVALYLLALYLRQCTRHADARGAQLHLDDADRSCRSCSSRR